MRKRTRPSPAVPEGVDIETPRVEAPHVEEWDIAYRRYQVRLATEYLLPVLRQWGVTPRGRNVLEVGCGDGGCAAAFERAGARVTATDLDARLVGIAAELNHREGLQMMTAVGDVLDPHCPGFERGPFDLVLLRDVVEHLEDLPRALDHLQRHLEPGGLLFVVFPPYYSPFGAHQQILPRRRPLPWNKLPWLQLLPEGLFLRLVAGDSAHHREVARLSGIRLTLSRFRSQVDASGWRIRQQRLYLLRPTFRLRYGLPVVPAGILGDIPGLRELVVTGAYFLLERR
jgi:SAM-dependent methyltransferase